jgi:hypothetical protein
MRLIILNICNHRPLWRFLRLKYTPLLQRLWHGKSGHRGLEHSQVLLELEHFSVRLSAYDGNCRNQAIALKTRSQRQ